MTIKGLRDGLIQDLAENVYLNYRFGLEGKKMLYEALEKQIPKKPKDHYYTRVIYDNEGYEVDALFIYKANCPCCNELISEGELEKSDLRDIKYCQSCGQKFEWSDEDDEL